MRLSELTIENFRAFRSATVSLPEQGLVLVAGANNSGKSALLSSLDIVAGIGPNSSVLRHVGSEDPATVAATFITAEAERNSIFDRTPKSGWFMATGAGSRLQFVFQEEDQNLQLSEFRAEWPDRGMQTVVTTGWDTESPNYSLKVMRALLPGEDPDPFALVSIDPRYGGPVPLQMALANTREPAASIMMPLLDAWRSRFYHFRALRPGTQREVALQVAPTLVPSGENLAAVLLDLLTNRPELLEQLRGLIAQIVPDIGRLGIRTNGNQMQIVFAANGLELNLKDLGTGVEQLLLTLVVGLTEAPPFTMVIEEPETNLHPAAQRALLGMLKIWADKRQIIAATHSSIMLDWSPGGDRLWHVTRAGETSSVEPVREDPSVLLNALGVRLSDVLSSDRILVLEGPSDQEILEVWFPDVLRNPNVALLQGEGGDNARYADLFAEWLTGVDTIGVRRVLYLRDRDELSPAAMSKLEASSSVAVLRRREIENYLLDPAAVTAVLASLIRDRSSLPSVDDVARAMTEAAEGLRRRIVVNRTCRAVVPPNLLMDHKLRQQLADAGADKEAITASVLERLLSPAELRALISEAWDAAESDVASQTGEALLAIAPGEEILKTIFKRFADRGYSKLRDGVAIAKAMAVPPEEIKELLEEFMLMDG
jgi:energy-coupling factor transporter ATP-binding protein EcfA2